MPALQRSVSQRGARFYRDGDEVMFVHHIDASTREGPRKAAKQDSLAHPEAWAEFQSDEPKAPRRREPAEA